MNPVMVVAVPVGIRKAPAPVAVPPNVPSGAVSPPLLAMESPVSVGELPFDPNSRFNEPEGFDEFPIDSAIHW